MHDRRKRAGYNNEKQKKCSEVASTCIRCFSAVQLYTTVLKGVRTRFPTATHLTELDRRLLRSVLVLLSTLDPYSMFVGTLSGAFEKSQTTKRPSLSGECFTDTLMVITLSDFPYLLSQHTELHTLFEQTSTVSQTVPETPKTEKPTKQTNSGNPLSFNLFSSLYLFLISSHRI